MKYRNGQITVAGLIEELKKLPEDKGIICQLVASEDSGAWNMFFEFNEIENSDWVIQLKIFHPEFRHLPDEGEKHDA